MKAMITTTTTILALFAIGVNILSKTISAPNLIKRYDGHMKFDVEQIYQYMPFFQSYIQLLV